MLLYFIECMPSKTDLLGSYTKTTLEITSTPVTTSSRSIDSKITRSTGKL